VAFDVFWDNDLDNGATGIALLLGPLGPPLPPVVLISLLLFSLQFLIQERKEKNGWCSGRRFKVGSPQIRPKGQTLSLSHSSPLSHPAAAAAALLSTLALTTGLLDGLK